MRRFPACRKPTDGVHLATALRLNVDEMHTYDKQDLIALSGQVHRADGRPLIICTPHPLPPPPRLVSLGRMPMTSSRVWRNRGMTGRAAKMAPDRSAEESDGSDAPVEADPERAVKQLMRHLLSKPPEPRSTKGPKGTPGRPPKRPTQPRER
jgi:hypothetical protein